MEKTGKLSVVLTALSLYIQAFIMHMCLHFNRGFSQSSHHLLAITDICDLILSTYIKNITGKVMS